MLSYLRNWTRAWRDNSPTQSLAEEAPLRSALFNSQQMAEHGKALAASHKLAKGRAPDLLLARLEANEKTLVEACGLISAAVLAQRGITPAGAWLLDNFYLVEEQIRTTKRHLPKDYSRGLPRLAGGPSQGRPRVYDIALEIVSHGDGRVDTEILSHFVTAYQSVSALKLGELWAIPIMLRLAVIENLARIAMRIAKGRDDRNQADHWLNKMIETVENEPTNLILVVADMARSQPPMSSAFVAEIARRLQGRGPALSLPINWIEQRLSESGLTIELLVQLETQQQAADQLSTSNSIGSLRVLGSEDWRDFVEQMSLVEQVLLSDPHGVYGKMDFVTRDLYRHATERIAKQAQITESAVALKAVELAHAGVAINQRAGHVGYYLIDEGVAELEVAVHARHSSWERICHAATRNALPLYLGAIILLTVAIVAGILPNGLTKPITLSMQLIMGMLAFVAASQLAVALVNWASTLLLKPRPLPKLDFRLDIPADLRTLVAVPTMLSSRQNIEDLVEALEVRFLANRDANLHFALLTDFLDAAEETLPGDEPLLRLAQARIEELNKKYASHSFFLFHRPRLWNPGEGRWMGYERKRGKLAALNAFLRGGNQSAFALIVGETAALGDVKYVITLDTDTLLPLDAARHLIGAMAHPLNQPIYDKVRRRVIAGYGILQPRMAVNLPATARSRYAKLFGGEVGIDPYTRAVSDVYQDAFGEGSFIGKGIYDVDAFEEALRSCFPENRILSHDLIEGCYARSGLVSDIQLYEDYPARYAADVKRRHRWIRGDWQLAAWLRNSVPGDQTTASSAQQSNPLTALSKWKLLDNLRRSLVPAAMTGLLISGWTFLHWPCAWTLLVIGILLLPALCALLVELLRKPAEVLFRQHLAAVAHSGGRRIAHLFFEIACLPYEAYYSLDAVLRTVWRMLVSGKHLLAWTPSSEVDQALSTRNGSGLAAALRDMWFAPVLAVAIAMHLLKANPAALGLAGPILLLWFLSPVITWWISRPLASHAAQLNAEQTGFLRVLARRTWAFFDTFVVAEDNWLPPDNCQDYRVASVAHRTSPTNIGMALLANLAAYDFGYIPTGDLLRRTANTLNTMDNLERYRGHFYNWYDTQTLQPLLPLYVSTVDSGNLAGHLLTLGQGLLALADTPIWTPRQLAGLQDTLNVLQGSADGVAQAQIDTFAFALNTAVTTPPDSLNAVSSALTQLMYCADELRQQVNSSCNSRRISALANEAQEWAEMLARQCRMDIAELNLLAPWLTLGGLPENLTTLDFLHGIPTLRELALFKDKLAVRLTEQHATTQLPLQLEWLDELRTHVEAGSDNARERLATLQSLAQRSAELANMEYDFLFDRVRHLLSIGYNVSERKMDAGAYDLLASEARLCSFVGIAQGQLPQDNWFALGRLLTSTDAEPVLLSWSGSMFEYLMPLLVMPTYDNTLLDQTCKAAVARQIAYGKQRGVPWGISESGYNTVDGQLNYQYRAFGVPGLGLKRGLADDLVIAPYASVMALMVAPEAACANLQQLAAEGIMGKYGMFEAVDYTPSRQRRGQTHTVVRSFMAHHQGMSLLSLAYLLLQRPMQRRFETDRLFQSVMLLLQERIPKATALFPHTAQLSHISATPMAAQAPIRMFTTPDTPIPEVQLLSNGRYHVMLSNAGGGYSHFKGLAITRWREDGTRDNWGSFCYIREVASGAFWSTSFQPTLKRPTSYEATFSEGRAEFRRRDTLPDGMGSNAGDIETYTEIVVSPEDDIELRRVHICNRSQTRREIEVTSYAEVVIAAAAADTLHPAFSNLFVQTEILPERSAILCTRRPRAAGEQPPWMLHLMAVHGGEVGVVSYETDRLRFVGRTRNTASPLALNSNAPLSGSAGSVLDPIVAIRYRITLEPEQTTSIDIVSGIADSRELATSLIEKYRDRHLADRVFDLSWTYSQVVLRQINATEADSQLYARLASSVLYVNPSLRADAAILLRNRRGQSGLWGYAISGDLPIVLVQIGDAANLDLVRQMVQAHAYWRLKGLAVDLVIWNEDHAGYRQRLQEQIMGLIASRIGENVIDRPGGIFVRSAEHISNEDRVLFQSVARAVIKDDQGTLEEQLDLRSRHEARPPRLVPTRTYRPEAPPVVTQHHTLRLFNGLGGFSEQGHEYVMHLLPGQVTPAPWANVLANAEFGTVISESGIAYTWSENAHEFRLTPWHNDPVSDAGGEALYLRDEETGYIWSPTPLPSRAATTYVVRHGFGYSVFETKSGGISTELWVYVATDAAIKFSVLKIRNDSGRARKLSATGYVEWVLGDLRAKSAMHITTDIDTQSGALLARNPYNSEFVDRVAFFHVDDPARYLTGDRLEFLGRNGTQQNPIALHRARLSGKVGAGLDPCAALQVHVELAPAETREIVFRLGVGRSTEDAGQILQRFRGADAARSALDAVSTYWNTTLGAVQVDTPDAAINMLSNGWLIYQTLACRIWARSGYYQSGGAFGFRDQLQDSMALVHTKPALAREHLLLCASRQFAEGDVQHWWHPPTGRGVRTHCSDDYLWLPLATCRYVMSTGDSDVLTESSPFLEGRPVNAEDDSYYDLPGRTSNTASLYEHCVLAIRHGLRLGEHGLPLMGGGDWNDGMNLVGLHGKGESIWLAFFLYEVLTQFAKLASQHGDGAFAEQCLNDAKLLQQSIEAHGWDGEWYRRAYFDDGSPLGSTDNEECRIDSISQSWSVLSGAADAKRSRMAMNAVNTYLVRRDAGIVQLLDPPFDKSALDPGYIRGYVPGVRENGGQYTHGAIWAAMAFAALDDRERAWELISMINPLNHAATPAAVATYKVEPYVIAADVYGVAPHIGRGGWSWYTGSAGWMYRLLLESLLGIKRQGDTLQIAPCLPAHWPSFSLTYRYQETVYQIVVTQKTADGAVISADERLTLDGETQKTGAIYLMDDKREHRVEVVVYRKF